MAATYPIPEPATKGGVKVYQDVRDAVISILGLGEQSLELGVNEMVLRAILVYFFTLVLIRVGPKRFLGQHTAFDVVMGIILGTVVSRAVTGSAAFFPSLAAGLTLVVLHWLMSAMAYRSHNLGHLLKGEAQTLVETGEVQWDHMRSNHISERDLLQALRENANLKDLAQVAEARLERNGIISIVPRPDGTQSVEVNVEDNVQTVRIQLG